MDIAIGILHTLFNPIEPNKVQEWNNKFQQDSLHMKLSTDGHNLYKIMYRMDLQQFMNTGGMSLSLSSAVNYLKLSRQYPELQISNKFEFFAIPIINGRIPLETWFTCGDN